MFKKQSPVRLKNKAKGKPARRILDPSKRMLLRQLIIGLSLFAVLGLIITGIWYGTRIDSLTIQTINVSGGETISAEAVTAVIAPTLEGNYAGLIPRRFALWYPVDDVYAALATVPRLKDPMVTRTNGTTIVVTYDEYVPFALWCVDRSSDTCLFVDATGYAFSVAPKLKGGALIRYRTLGADPVVGERLATPAELTTMTDFIRLVSTELAFEIESVETDSAGDVFYILAEGGEFKAALRTPAPEVFDNLRTILAAPEFSDIKPGNFQYIDLRFGSKVFVNEELPTMASSTATSSATSSDPL